MEQATGDKPKRGRPKGSRTGAGAGARPNPATEPGAESQVGPAVATSQEASLDLGSSIRVESQATVKVPPVKLTGKAARKAKEQAEVSARLLLMVLDSAVGAAFGEEAKLLDYEAEMLIDPLGRMMLRAGPATTAALEKYTDPILLLFGLVTWGSRVFSIATRSDEGDEPPNKPTWIPAPPPGGNGNHAEPIPAAGPGEEILAAVDAGSAHVEA